MPHVRQQIREEVVSRINAIPALSGKVKASRVYTVQGSPFVAVYTGVEEAQQDDIARINAHSARLLTVKIEIYSNAGSENFDKEIDNLCALIEPALANDPASFAMAQTWEYTGCNIEYSGDAERAGGVAVLEYVFNYRVRIDDPLTGV